MKLDFGVVYKGFYGDSARTVPVGKVSAEAQALVDATRESLYKGDRAMVAGNRIGDIGHAVQAHVEARGLLGGARLHGPRDRQEAPRGAAGAQLRRARAPG